MALSELERRKPCFDEANSAPVVFGDGQTWYLPKPWLEVRPVFKGARAASAYPCYTYGPQLEQFVDAITELDDSFDRVSAVATLAAELLRWQYDLTDADLDQILVFRIHDEASAQWARDTIAIATGQSGPKRSRAGGD